jgi:uncharacterized membrane protein
MKFAPRASGKVGRLREHLAAGLAYLTFVPALAFLLMNPYRKNRFVRFHSIQSLLFCLACITLAVLVRLLSLVLLLMPVVGPLLVLLLTVLAALAALISWIVLLVKAFQGQMFALPVIGELAEQYSGAA